jgi:hypothetical protein
MLVLRKSRHSGYLAAPHAWKRPGRISFATGLPESARKRARWPTRHPVPDARKSFCRAVFRSAGVASERLFRLPGAGGKERCGETRKLSHSFGRLLDEPDWMAAPPIGDILQREPTPGQPPSERTEVKLLYDDNFLYVGVMCFDQPDSVIGTRMARDSNLSDDDHIELLVDPYRDRRNAFYFSTNPLGALVDGLIIENGTLNRDWDAIWMVRTRSTEEGWSAEFAIPFKSLSFNASKGVWGFNFSRTIKRKIEEDRWASPRLDTQFLQVSEAGEITGLSEVTQGRGLDLRPFAAGRWLRQAQAANNVLTGKPGLDAFYNLTPNLKWTTTVNTDFGETEVDSRQINLTRFPTFFPEKRSFFLENAGVFDFGNNPRNVGSDTLRLLPFFSRRIGLVGNEEVPILFGTKLTGKVGRTDIGVLDVRTRDTYSLDAKNFIVARMKQNVFRQSYIGGIYIQGNPAQPIHSDTFGGDLRLGTSSFLGRNRNFALTVFALNDHNQGVSGDTLAYGLSAEYPNDLVNASVHWRDVQRNFQPALGFVSSNNVRFVETRFEFDPRPKGFLGLRQMFHEFFFTHYTRLDTGESESWQFRIAPINWRFNSGDEIEFGYLPQFEHLFEPRTFSGGVVLPVGDYRYTRWRARVMAASKRRLSGQVRYWFGSYYSGRAQQIDTNLNYRLPPSLQISFVTTQTFAKLPQGNFVTRVFTANVDYSLTPFITFYNLIQFDNDSRNLGWQSRIRWIFKPGNDFFLSFNQGWIQEPDGGLRYDLSDTKLAAKVQYTFRF